MTCSPALLSHLRRLLDQPKSAACVSLLEEISRRQLVATALAGEVRECPNYNPRLSRIVQLFLETVPEPAVLHEVLAGLLASPPQHDRCWDGCVVLDDLRHVHLVADLKLRRTTLMQLQERTQSLDVPPALMEKIVTASRRAQQLTV